MDALTIAAASGLRSRMQSLDLLANNLANAATSGFKRDQEFYGLYSSAESENPNPENPDSTLPIIEKQWTDFSPGLIQETGNPLDIALSGNGFFAVNSPSGPLYTRNGSLHVLPTGELADAENHTLRDSGGGSIRVAKDIDIGILPDGTVSQNGQPVGRIAVVNFKSTNSLRKFGGTSFQNTDVKNVPTAATDMQVQQGKLEGSNVPVAEAAMRLVGMMRQFEMLQKAVGVSNDMDTKTIQEVARVGS
jgi:flagellar basal-body rod protein FlgF